MKNRFDMPILSEISKQMSLEKPLAGAKIAVVFHLTDPVVNMVLALIDAGAEIFLLSSKKETAVPSALEALEQARIDYKNPDYAEKDKCLREVIDFQPHLMIDNADLFKLWHSEKNMPLVLGSTIHSRSAYDVVEKYRNADNPLYYPVVGIGSSKLKLELESTLGTGQSVISALVQVTKLQLNGKKIAIVGCGNVGSGIAGTAKAMGACVMIVEKNAYTALRAMLFHGYEVVSLEEAARSCDILLTATGSQHVLTESYFRLLPDGAFIGNIGRYEAIDIDGLEKLSTHINQIDPYITEYTVDGKCIYIMAEGKQLNHIVGEGNSSEIMDLSIAMHVLAMEYIWKNHQTLSCSIYSVPESITEKVALSKLQHLGVNYLS